MSGQVPRDHVVAGPEHTAIVWSHLMGKKKNLARMVIHLECTESRNLDVPGVSRYTTKKNKKNTPKRLELMKYNKFLRRHTLHREVK